MTVTEKSSRKLISGTGWANPLTHNFELENSTHLKVYADDVELTLGVDYSITGVGVDTGYSVTITTPGDWAPDVWVLSVEPPINQGDDVSLGGVFGGRFEEGLDSLARRVQRLWDGVTRSWKVPRTQSGEAPTMEVLDEDHFWVADADGNMVDGGSGADIAGAGAAATAAAVSAAAASSSASAAAAALAAMQALVPSVSSFIIAHYDAASAVSMPAAIQNLTLGGRRAFGDRAGWIPCTRVSSQPAHIGWVRTADRYLPNGNIDNTNGGYWEFQNGGFCNVVAFGAYGNGTTDDWASIQGCVNYINAKYGVGGQVWFPAASAAYLSLSTIDISVRPLTMLSANQRVTIHSGAADINLVKIGTSNVMLKDLSLYGKGINGLATADTAIGASQPVVWLTTSAVNSKIDNCIIYGGSNAVLWEGGDCKMFDCEVSRSYGDALVKVKGSGWMRRNALDHANFQIPRGLQTVTTAFPAWASATVYAVGAIVSSGGFIIECTTAGTSGGVAPTLKNYNVAIPDGAGTLVWSLVAPVYFRALLCDTGATELYCHQQDMTGPFSYAMEFRNCTGLAFRIEKGIAGQNRDGAVLVRTGRYIRLMHMTIGGGPIINFPGVLITDTFAGEFSISDSDMEGVGRGVYFALTGPTAASVAVINNLFKCTVGSGTLARPFQAIVDMKFFRVIGNHFGLGCTSGVLVEAGGSDHYNITGNINGSGMSGGSFIGDGGTGTNKTVQSTTSG